MAEDGGDPPVVVVVDDDQALADLYASHLEREYEVRTAYDGEAALEAIDDSVDVVLLDRRMPGQSGDEVLETIRDRGYDGGVVMLTAVNLDFDAVEMEYDEYLVKPVTLGELDTTVSRIVTLSSGESGPKRYYALVAKRYAFEMRKATSELRENDEYQALLEELEALREELDDDVANRLDGEASAAVFGARGGDAIDDPDLEEVLKEVRASAGAGTDDSASTPPPGKRALHRPESRVVFDHVDNPIFVVNPERELMDCNAAFTERFGYAHADIEGEPATMLYAGSEEGGSGDGEERSAAGDRVGLRTKDGEVLEVELAVLDLKDEAGERIGRVAVVKGDGASQGGSAASPAADVTAARLLQHEIGNELSRVSALIGQQIEEADEEDRPRLETVLDVVGDISDRLAVYSEYVTAARIPGEERTDGVEIEPVVEEVVDQLRETEPGATIELEAVEPATVRADDLLEVVVRNLIENAIRHNDTEDPHVAVSVTVDDDVARLEVVDDGPGIPEPIRETILEREQKGADSQGMGLGLYLVDQLVTAYGGSIDIDDGPSGGARVVVTFDRLE